eukprot:7834742-Pyramimonas_sp.AAC.1
MATRRLKATGGTGRGGERNEELEQQERAPSRAHRWLGDHSERAERAPSLADPLLHPPSTS